MSYRRGNGYRSAAERRSKMIADFFFAILATIAVGVQVFLLIKYLDLRTLKSEKAAAYTLIEAEMKTAKQQRDSKQSEYDSLISQIEKLNAEISANKAE